MEKLLFVFTLHRFMWPFTKKTTPGWASDVFGLLVDRLGLRRLLPVRYKEITGIMRSNFDAGFASVIEGGFFPYHSIETFVQSIQQLEASCKNLLRTDIAELERTPISEAQLYEAAARLGQILGSFSLIEKRGMVESERVRWIAFFDKLEIREFMSKTFPEVERRVPLEERQREMKRRA